MHFFTPVSNTSTQISSAAFILVGTKHLNKSVLWALLIKVLIKTDLILLVRVYHTVNYD